MAHHRGAPVSADVVCVGTTGSKSTAPAIALVRSQRRIGRHERQRSLVLFLPADAARNRRSLDDGVANPGHGLRLSGALLCDVPVRRPDGFFVDGVTVKTALGVGQRFIGEHDGCAATPARGARLTQKNQRRLTWLRSRTAPVDAEVAISAYACSALETARWRGTAGCQPRSPLASIVARRCCKTASVTAR